VSGEIVLGEDRFRRRAEGDWEMLTRAPDVTITFGSTEATERRWRQLSQALDKIAAERAEVERLRRYADSIHEDRMMVLQEVRQKTADLTAARAEIERLRAAGDALAEVVCSWHGERIPLEMLDPLTEWEEARRD
jgi:hypothetical protein